MPLPRMIIIASLLFMLAGCSEAADGTGGDATSTPTTRPTATSTRSSTGVETLTATAVTTPTPASARGCAAPYPQPPFTAETVLCRDPAGMQRASLARVVDGDTLHVVIEGIDVTVRIFGIDTADRGERCFEEAADRLAELAAHGVLLVADLRDEDSFDRLLRYLYTPDGLSIDAVLISEGLAHAWTRDGALRDPLVELESRARAAGTGCLWS